MTANLRASLAIFSIGFAIEGAGEFYAWVTHSAGLAAGGVFLVVGPIFTMVGLLFLWVGRHEWNETHRQRVRHAHGAFFVAVLSFIAAGAPLAYYATRSNAVPPAWVAYEFGAAVGGLLLFSFVTYLLVVYHLVGVGGKGTLVAALAWSLGVSGWAGYVIGGDLATYLEWARSGSVNVAAVAGPLTGVFAYFFISYFLLFAAYADAHRRVAQGLATEPFLAPAPEPT